MPNFAKEFDRELAGKKLSFEERLRNKFREKIRNQLGYKGVFLEDSVDVFMGILIDRLVNLDELLSDVERKDSGRRVVACPL